MAVYINGSLFEDPIVQISRKERDAGFRLLQRQENATTARALEPGERELLLLFFHEVGNQLVQATEALEHTRPGSKNHERWSARVEEAEPLWERLRIVTNRDAPPPGYMQGRGAAYRQRMGSQLKSAFWINASISAGEIGVPGMFQVRKMVAAVALSVADPIA